MNNFLEKYNAIDGHTLQDQAVGDVEANRE